MMKTNLVLHSEPDKFVELLNQFIKKAETDGYTIRDIKYMDLRERYSALLVLIKLHK